MIKHATLKSWQIAFVAFFLAFTFTACRKQMDQPATFTPANNISWNDIKQYTTTLRAKLKDPVELIYDQAQQRTVNGKHYVRIPASSAGVALPGSFYFNKRSDGQLQAVYVLTHQKDKQKPDGMVGFTDLDHQTIHLAAYQNDKLVAFYKARDTQSLFADAFRSNTSTIQKKVNDACEEVTSIMHLSDGRDSVLVRKVTGGIECPGHRSFWQKLGDFFGGIWDGITDAFDWLFGWMGGGGSADNSGGYTGGFDYGGYTDWGFIDYISGPSNPGSDSYWGAYPTYNPPSRVESLVDVMNNAGNGLSQTQINWLNNNPAQASDLLDWITEIQSDESIDEAAYQMNNTIAAKIVINEEINGLADGPYDDTYAQSVMAPNLPLPSVIPIGSYAAKWAAAYSNNCIMLKLQHPYWGKWHIRYEAVRWTLHLGLDVIGLVPVIGTVANLLNATLYTIHGEGVNATLSVLAAVPVAGWVSAGAKAAIKGENIMIKATDGLIKFTRDQNAFRKALGLVKRDGLIAHHIIPVGLAERPLVQKAAEGGFHINELLNGIAVTSLQQAGSHPQYDARVLQKFEDILQKYGRDINNITPSQAYAEITDLINQIKTAITNNPGVKLNDLIF